MTTSVNKRTANGRRRSTGWEAFLQGARDGFPIFLGYVSVSFSFGMMTVNLLLPAWSAVLISLTNLTSAGQFAGITLISAAAALMEMALTQLVINIRYALMSASLSQHVDGSMTLLHRLGCAFFITDEIFAVCISNPKPVSNRYMYGLGLVAMLGWCGGTALGAFAGSLLPQSVRMALNLSLYAMFVAIVVPKAKKERAVLLVAGIAAGLHCLMRALPVFSGLSDGFALILCSLPAAVLGAILFPKEDA